MLREDSTKKYSPEEIVTRESRIIWGTVLLVLAALGLLAIAGRVWGQTPEQARADSLAAYYDSQRPTWKEGAFAFTRFSPYIKPLGFVYQGSDARFTAGFGLSYRYTNWFGASLEQTLVYGKQPRTSLTTKIVLW